MPKPLSELRKLPRSQIKAITKDDLIDSIMAEQDPDDVALHYITDKLNDVMQEIAQLKNAITSPESAFNKKIIALQDQVHKQSEIIAKQQRFLEVLDKKERECNLILLGVPDEGETLDTLTEDKDKVKKIFEAIGTSGNISSIRRLGQRNVAEGSRRRRPILITVESRIIRDGILEKAKALKQREEVYKKIFIKKDVHPSVRAEWRRLYEAEKRERERPENVGCNILFNARERKLYKDGVVIDKWGLLGF